MGSEISNPEEQVVLITGGSGFLGLALVEEFLAEEAPIQVKEIRIFDLVEQNEVSDSRLKFIQGDVRDLSSLVDAFEGVDLVIHSAAVIDWGAKDEEEVMGVNVGGTKNVIEACNQSGVGRLILTSSLDSVYTGTSLIDIDESQPYPAKSATSYCKSKTLAEKAIISANDEKLMTCVLRPASIFGERDPYHIPPLIEMSEGGFYTRLGNGKSVCQHIYVRNMAWSHLLAGKELLEGNSKVSGQIYFITDGEPVNFFTFFDRIVRESGYKIWPSNLWLPKWFALPIAALSELGAWVIRPFMRVNLKFSRFAVNYTCTDYTFTSEKARKDFGFIPKYSGEEAIKRTVGYFAKLDTN